MRDLLLMRGVPGCGKSTFIEKHGLEPYTICPDKIRLMFESPVVNPETGETSISQKNDKKVWELVNELVEEKMNRGEFIVIDAMNIDISNWRKLADKYRYRIWYKNFNESLETCIYRNNHREGYKRVPEEVICRAYKRMDGTVIPKYANEITDSFFDGIKPLDVNKYDNIFVIGDIHGCFEPVKKFFDEHSFSNDNLYVFCGDYLDRGPNNKETLEFLLSFIDCKNVMFLEGNHNWEKYWANDEIEQIRSKEFLLNTINQIKDVDKAKVREWCRRWIQMAYLEFNGQKYFITHAGLGFCPDEKFMRFIPSYDMIRGGKYEEDVDTWYDEKETDVIQIHGHRNIYEYPVDKFKKSFNLNASVEFGEPLRIMQISKSGFHFYHYENESCKGKPNPWKKHKSNNIAITMNNKTNLTKDEQFVMSLRKSSDIIEKSLNNGISSFNFKRSVFFSDKWNELNSIARGLFIDIKDCKIVARSYKKFFNYKEGNKNTNEFLENNLKFPVIGYLKYNGFLGMMSYDYNLNDLHFFSKSTDESDFAHWFKEIALEKFNQNHVLEEVKEYLKNNHVTMVFEVIDPVNDPHIIEYKEKNIWLLDIIDNEIDFNKRPYNELCEIADKFNLNVKEQIAKFYSFDALKDYLVTKEREKDYSMKNPIEGVVFEDANGYMFKYKFGFYTFWKKMRGVKQQIQKGGKIDYYSLNEVGKAIADFMKDNFTCDELSKLSIIDIRNKFFKFFL